MNYARDLRFVACGKSRVRIGDREHEPGRRVGIEDLTRARHEDAFEISFPAQLMIGQLVGEAARVIGIWADRGLRTASRISPGAIPGVSVFI
jgi:hypothetical protein